MTQTPDGFDAPQDAPLPMPPLPPPLPAWAAPLAQPPATLPYAFVPPSPPPPRVWPAIVVPLVAVFAAAIASTVAILVFAAVDGGAEVFQDEDRLTAWIAEAGSTPLGLLTLVLPGQLTFLIAAALAGWLSPEPIAQRLSLVRPTTPWWATFLLLAPATFFAGALGDLLTQFAFGDAPSEHLETLYAMFRGPSGASLVLLVVLISVMPGFGEELLFRGYCQGRLLRRMPAAAALAISSVVFAAAHLDPMHVLAVLPLGVWLGVVAWLSRSIWPAVVCHTVNNATAVLLTNFGVIELSERIAFDAAGLTMLGVTGAFAVAAVWVMVKWRSGTTEPRGFTVGPSLLPSPLGTGERE